MIPTATPDTRLQALTDGLTDSERYRLLADDCRQLVLEALHERDRPMQLDDLAATVAAATDHDADRESDTLRARTILHHKQLPMMDELGVLSYEVESGRVQLS